MTTKTKQALKEYWRQEKRRPGRVKAAARKRSERLEKGKEEERKLIETRCAQMKVYKHALLYFKFLCENGTEPEKVHALMQVDKMRGVIEKEEKDMEAIISKVTYLTYHDLEAIGEGWNTKMPV